MYFIFSQLYKDIITIGLVILLLIISILVFMFPFINKESREINKSIEKLYEDLQLDGKHSKFSYFAKIFFILTLLFLSLILVILYS